MHYFFFLSSHWSLNCDSYLQLTGQKADLSMKGSPYWMAPEVPASSYFYILLHKFLQPRASPRWNNYFFLVAHDGCHAER